MGLKTVRVSAAYLKHPEVASFSCGTSASALLAAEWIKNAPPFPCALQSMEDHDNDVWLHFVAPEYMNEEFLIGYSSLGTTKWRIPPPDGERREVGFLPMLAVGSEFQGRHWKDEKYSDAILKHVIEKSRERGHRELCLFVHKENPRAISLYTRHGFLPIGVPDERGLVKMLKFLD